LGRLPELTGGRLIRSLRGWEEVKAQRRQRASMKGDERILGESEYVTKVLRAANESLKKEDKRVAS
jgi:putative transposase